MIDPTRKLQQQAKRRVADVERKGRGRTNGSRNYAVNPRTWAVAQTALDDDPYARQWEREQGR